MTTARSSSSEAQEKHEADDRRLASLEDAIDRAHMRPTLRVHDVMTKNVVSCGPTDTAEQAARIMWEERCGCVPIVDADRHPISIVTDRDICMAAWTQGQPLGKIIVSSAMSSRLFTANVADEVASAEATMRRHGVRRLPVVNDRGELVGILSLDDIAHRGDPGPVRLHDPLAPTTVLSTVIAVGRVHDG